MELSIYEKTLDDLEASLFAVNEAKKMFNDFLDVLLKNKKRFAKGSSFLQEGQYEGEMVNNNDYEDIFDDEESPVTSLVQVAHRLNKLKHTVKEEGIKLMISGLA